MIRLIGKSRNTEGGKIVLKQDLKPLKTSLNRLKSVNLRHERRNRSIRNCCTKKGV